MRRLLLLFMLLLLNISPPLLASEKVSDRTLRVREFVVMGYQGIVGELSAGKGPYLTTLEALLNVPTERQGQMTGDLSRLVKEYPNIMDFADHVLLLRGAAPMVTEATPVPSAAAAELENSLQHLSKGVKVILHLHSGEKVEGIAADYNGKTLWIRNPGMKSFRKEEIQALDVPAR